MSRIILIDGENFLYGLRFLMAESGIMAPRNNFVNFPFADLIQEVMGDAVDNEIFYYGAKLKEYSQTPELLEKSKRAIKFQLKLANTLKKQDITLVKVGYLRAREAAQCPSCGANEWKLLEKGVDVGLAVRLITEANPNTEIVLISSDTDLLPAVHEAINKGAKIIFVGYENHPILSLIKASTSHRVITKQMVDKRLRGKE